jgi:hypothetical protein
MKISELNSLLNIKCNNLSLSLNYIYNSPNNRSITVFDNNEIDKLLLCLNNNYGCISSILFDVREHIDDSDYSFDSDDSSRELELSLSSKTKEKFEGKKYNKFLRAVVVLICPLLQIRYIASFAINPISAYLLMTHFNAVPDQKFIRFMKKFLKTNAEIPLLEFLQNKYQQPINLEIDTYNATTAQKAQAVINELFGEHIEKNIICN